MIPTATDDAPWLTMPHWHDHTTVVVSTAHWSKTLLIPEEWLCGCVHCTQQKTGLVHSRSECWMRPVPMALPFSTDASRAQTMLTRSQIIGAFKRLGWAYPDYAIPQGLKKFERLLTTGHIIPCGDDRLETQPTPPPQYADKVLNNTHLMFKYPPFLVDANKWCDNKVETRDVHCALKPLRGSLRTTQIVASVSKVAWTRVRRMPCDQTRNHTRRFVHNISLHVQPTHWCKCDKTITVAQSAHLVENGGNNIIYSTLGFSTFENSALVHVYHPSPPSQSKLATTSAP